MNSTTPSGFRAGIVVLLGRTNVGKSTLINVLVGSKISIVTPKPQTTRHAIHGIIHRPEGQIVLVDTPGFFRTHRSQLVDRLHARARAALESADAVLHVVDPSRPPGVEDRLVIEVLERLAQPKVLCLTKSDLRRRPHCAEWLDGPGAYVARVEVSAVAQRGLDGLVESLLALLPVGVPLYPEDQATNAGLEFRMAEVIREKIYLLTGEEVPYRTSVRLDATEERAGRDGQPLTAIQAVILVAQDRYKAMLIGARGRMIRDIGSEARTDLERLVGRKVFLSLRVAVDRQAAD